MHHRQRKSYETLVRNNKSEPILFPDISMRNAGTCSHISPHRFQVQRSESRPDTIRLTHMRSGQILSGQSIWRQYRSSSSLHQLPAQAALEVQVYFSPFLF